MSDASVGTPSQSVPDGYPRGLRGRFGSVMGIPGDPTLERTDEEAILHVLMPSRAPGPLRTSPITKWTSDPPLSQPLGIGTLTLTGRTKSTLIYACPGATGGLGPFTYQFNSATDSNGSPGSYGPIGSNDTTQSATASSLTASTPYWGQVVVTDAASNTATSADLQASTKGLHDAYMVGSLVPQVGF